MGLVFRHPQLLHQEPLGPVDGADVLHLLLKSLVLLVQLLELGPQGRGQTDGGLQGLAGQGLSQGQDPIVFYLVADLVVAFPRHQQDHRQIVVCQILGQLGAEFVPEGGVDDDDVRAGFQQHPPGLPGGAGPQGHFVAAGLQELTQQGKGLVIGPYDQDPVAVFVQGHGVALLS